MRITKNDIPAKLDVPGAVARHLGGFGDAPAEGPIAAEYFSLDAGTDVAPLLVGLENDACQAPHWGYVISGRLVVSYTDGSKDTCAGDDLFYWPAGHSVRVEEDAEVILFSPQHEHAAVIQHLREKIGVG